MTATQPGRPRPSWWRRQRGRAGSNLPVVVWVLAILGLLKLAEFTPAAHGMPAIVDSRVATLLAPVDGRVAAVVAQLHQLVEADSIVARFDDRDVRLRVQQANYALERLRADMAHASAALEREARAAATAHGLDAAVEHRRLVSAIESAQLAALSTRTDLEEARIRLQGAAVETERLTSLARQAMIAEPELVRVRTERDALQKRIDELSALHAEQQVVVATARERLAAFAPGAVDVLPVDAALAPLRWQLKEQEAEIERIALDAQALDVRAPMRGHVTAIVMGAGEWAPSGSALLTIVDPTPRRILAYVPDTLRSQLASARSLQVQRADATRLGSAPILSMSSTAVRLPERLWRDPQREEWGYEMVLAATGAERPGERLHLHAEF